MGFSFVPYAAGAFPCRVTILSRDTTVRTPEPETSSKIPRPTNLRLLLGLCPRKIQMTLPALVTCYKKRPAAQKMGTLRLGYPTCRHN